MQLAEDPSNNLIIQAYEAGSIVINGEKYQQSILLSTHKIQLWDVDIDNPSADSLQEILAIHPEVFILGTGAKRLNLKMKTLAPLFETRIGVEIMDTAAACRTFNILSSENRNVVAGLIL